MATPWCRSQTTWLALLVVLVLPGACSRLAATRGPVPIEPFTSPRFSDFAREANLAGVVEVMVPVSDSGTVSGQLRFVRTPHDLLSNAVRRAVHGWRFQPRRGAARAVADSVRLTFVFVLDSSSRCGPREVRWRSWEPERPAYPPPQPPQKFSALGRHKWQVTACRMPHLVVEMAWSLGRTSRRLGR